MAGCWKEKEDQVTDGLTVQNQTAWVLSIFSRQDSGTPLESGIALRLTPGLSARAGKP